jgi:hypothetical protein
MLGRIEPTQEDQWVTRCRTRTARERQGLDSPVVRTKRRERDDQERTRRLDRRADEPLAGEHLDPVCRVQPPAKPRLRDERVEH